MRETQIIERIRRMAERGHRDRSLVKTIGDDCAILRPKVNEDLVFTSDFVLEDRHFTLETHQAADIGHKALARSLSDLAAMGAEPVFCMVSLAVPVRASSWVTQFYKGLLALAQRFSVTLAGGDLARFDKVIADVICCGRVPRGKALLRSGAKPGDRIYVTGELGRPWRRHLRPEPRIAAGLALRRLGASACIDVSDGLALDLQRLCLESRVSAELTSDLPIAHGASLQNALHGGEDYELLFTAAPKRRIPKHIAGLAITKIGTVTRARAGQIKLDGRRLKPLGFDHFQ
ncbi:MAG TPA: thiamine-phosphate kinase [Bryobacteraceae bacterium]